MALTFSNFLVMWSNFCSYPILSSNYVPKNVFKGVQTCFYSSSQKFDDLSICIATSIGGGGGGGGVLTPPPNRRKVGGVC
jgi:hypothetical protein